MVGSDPPGGRGYANSPGGAGISSALNTQLAGLFGITCTRTTVLETACYQIKTNGPSGGKHTVAWVRVLACVIRSILLGCQILL